MTKPRASRWLLAVLVWRLAGLSPVLAQTSTGAQTPTAAQVPASRVEQIELTRRRKHATLWPERESPRVVRANRLLDRGLTAGIQSGEGPNGWQFILAGTRPGQGQTFGVGYRRSDLFNDVLTARATARGTLSGGFLADLDLQVNGLQRSADTFVNVYSKFERSPHMEFYGLGADSLKEDRTRYLFNTGTANVRAGYRFARALNAGVDLGYGGVHTGSGSGDDVPSIETKFDATTAPGLFDDVHFFSWGAFAGYDTRDLPRGPKKGGFYGIELGRYVDVDEGKYTHRQLNVEGQQFIPYFNEQRVVAVMVKARFSYAGDEHVVPFYLQPKLGGNFELRGFNQYRFHDNNAFIAALEHRWYAFSGLEMALFVDAGKTVPEKGHINLSKLNYSGGVGLRVRLRNAIVLRMDIAESREGLRWIWSISDVSRRVF